MSDQWTDPWALITESQKKASDEIDRRLARQMMIGKYVICPGCPDGWCEGCVPEDEDAI